MAHIPITRELDLGGLQLSELPDESQVKWESILWLNASFNHLDQFPNELSESSRLQYLNLSHNRLGYVPQWILNLKGLRHFDLSHNRLVRVDVETLGQMLQLRHLNIGGNELGALPNGLDKLTLLTFLGLSGNCLKSSDELVGLSSLRLLVCLDLQDNAISTIPVQLASLSLLNELNLTGTHVPDIDQTLWRTHLCKHTHLSLVHKNLTDLPDMITGLSRLLSISLSDNLFADVPAPLLRMPWLQAIELDHNHLTTLPASLTSLSRLSRLDLTFNHLEALPDVLSALTCLSSIPLAGNRFSPRVSALLPYYNLITRHLDMTMDIGRLTANTEATIAAQPTLESVSSVNGTGAGSLVELISASGVADALASPSPSPVVCMDLSEDEVKLFPIPENFPTISALSLPPRFVPVALKDLPMLSKINQLVLRQCPAELIGDILQHMELLTSLTFEECPMSTLPEEITNCSNLVDLSVIGCGLSSVPSHINRLVLLKKIDLSNNKLSSLPEHLTDLSQLDSLKLENNPVSPEHIKFLQTYDFDSRELVLSGQSLSVVPESLVTFYPIRILDLSDNTIQVVPHFISEFQSIEELNLDNNELSSISSNIGKLSQMTKLNIARNPLSIKAKDIDDFDKDDATPGSDDPSSYYSAFPPELFDIPLKEITLPTNMTFPKHFSVEYSQYMKANFENPLDRPLVILQKLRAVDGHDETLAGHYEKYIIRKAVEMHEASKRNNEPYRIPPDTIFFATQANALEFLSHPLIVNEIRDIWYAESTLDAVVTEDPETGNKRGYADIFQSYLEVMISQLPSFISSPAAKFITSGISFVGFIVLTMLLLVILNQSNSVSSYYASSQLLSHFAVEDVRVDQDFWNYINTTFITQLQEGPKVPSSKASEYDMKVLLPSYYRVIYPIRLRQLRVKKKECSNLQPKRPDTTGAWECTPPFTNDFESRAAFGPNNTFKWLENNHMERLPVMGVSGIWYPGGGFTELLEADPTSMSNRLTYLEENNWLDLQTRVVFIEFIVVSDNIDTAIEVMIRFEFLGSGGILVTQKASPSTKYFYSFGMESFWIILILLGIYAFGLILSEVERFYHSRQRYIITMWSLLDVFIATIVLAILIIQIYLASISYKLTNPDQTDDFTDYYGVSSYANVQRALFAILCFFAWFRLLYFITLYPAFGLMLRIIGAMAGEMARFMILLFLIIVSFASTFYALFGSTLQGYSTTRLVLYTVGQFLFGNFNLEEIDGENPVMGPIAFFLFMFLCGVLLLNFLVAILSNTYEDIQANAKKQYNKIFAEIVLKTNDESAPPPLNVFRPFYVYVFKSWLSFIWKHRFPIQIYVTSIVRDRAWCWSSINDTAEAYKRSKRKYFYIFFPSFENYNDVYGGIPLTLWIDVSVACVVCIIMVIVQIPVGIFVWFMLFYQPRTDPSREKEHPLIEPNIAAKVEKEEIPSSFTFLFNVYRCFVLVLIILSMVVWVMCFFTRYIIILYKKSRVSDVDVNFETNSCQTLKSMYIFTGISESSLLTPSIKLSNRTIGYFEVEIIYPGNIEVGVRTSSNLDARIVEESDRIAYQVHKRTIIGIGTNTVITNHPVTDAFSVIGCGYDDIHREVYFKIHQSDVARFKIVDGRDFCIPYIRISKNSTIRLNFGRNWFVSAPPGYSAVDFSRSFREPGKGLLKATASRDIVYSIPPTEKIKTFLPQTCMATLSVDYRELQDWHFTIHVLNLGNPKRFSIGLTPKLASQFENPGNDHRAFGFIVDISTGVVIVRSLGQSSDIDENDKVPDNEEMKITNTSSFPKFTFSILEKAARCQLQMDTAVIHEFRVDTSILRFDMYPFVQSHSPNQVFLIGVEPPSSTNLLRAFLPDTRSRSASEFERRRLSTVSGVPDGPTFGFDMHRGAAGVGSSRTASFVSAQGSQRALLSATVQWEEGLWSELTGKTMKIHFRKDDSILLASCSLNRLIEHLTSKPFSARVFYDEKIFLLTFPLFAKPLLVYQRLEERYFVPSSITISEAEKQQIRAKVIHLMSLGLPLSVSLVGQSKGINDLLTNFLDKLDKEGTNSELFAKKIRAEMAAEPSIVPIQSVTSMRLLNVSLEKRIIDPKSLLEYESAAVAAHITYLDRQIFQKLKSTDLLHRANITRGIRGNNSTIKQIERRHRSLKNWIKHSVMQTSYNLKPGSFIFYVASLTMALRKEHNFHSVFAIVTGMKEGLGPRQEHIFSILRIPQDRSNELQSYFSSHDSHSAYRSLYGATSSPKLPYLEPHLAAIKKIADDEVNFVEREGHSLINYRKMHRIYDEVSVVMEATHAVDETPMREDLLEFLTNNIYLNEGA